MAQKITYRPDMSDSVYAAWKYESKEGKAAQWIESAALGFKHASDKILRQCKDALESAHCSSPGSTGDIWLAASSEVRAYALEASQRR